MASGNRESTSERGKQEQAMPGGEVKPAALTMALGVVGGEVLLFLEREPVVMLEELARRLERPAPLVAMAVGVLVRQGELLADKFGTGVLVMAKDGRSTLTEKGAQHETWQTRTSGAAAGDAPDMWRVC